MEHIDLTAEPKPRTVHNTFLLRHVDRRKNSTVASDGVIATLLGGLFVPSAASLLEILLVVLLRWVEPLRREDLGHDLLALVLRLLGFQGLPR